MAIDMTVINIGGTPYDAPIGGGIGSDTSVATGAGWPSIIAGRLAIPPGPTPAPVPPNATSTANLTPSNVGTATWGQPIPQSFGTRLIQGVPIYLSPIRSQGTLQVIDFAVAFGEQLAPAASRVQCSLIALWADTVQIYNIGTGGSTGGVGNAISQLQIISQTSWSNAPIGATPTLGTTTTGTAAITFTGGGGTGAAGFVTVTNYGLTGGTYSVISGVTLTAGGQGYTSAPTLSVPAAPGFVNPIAGIIPVLFIGNGLSNGLTTSIPGMGVTFYPGFADQQPDPTILAAIGAANTPAFRDLMYVVVTNFPVIAPTATATGASTVSGTNIPQAVASTGTGLPTFTAQIADMGATGTVSTSSYSQLGGAPNVSQNGQIIDRSTNSFYGIGNIATSSPVWERFNIGTLAQISSQPIVNSVGITNIHAGPSNWVAPDMNNNLILFHGDCPADFVGSSPIFVMDLDSARVIGSFGLVDPITAPSLSAYAAPIRTRIWGIDVWGLAYGASGGGVGHDATFLYYSHSVKPVQSINNAVGSVLLDRGGPVSKTDFSMKFDATTTVGNTITAMYAYDVLSRQELQSKFNLASVLTQCSILLAASDSNIQQITGTYAPGTTAGTLSMTLSQSLLLDFGVNLISDIFLDSRDGGIVIIHGNVGATASWISKFLPTFTQNDIGLTISSMTPVYQMVPLPSVYSPGSSKQSTKQSDTSTGYFAYLPTTNSLVVVQLDTGRAAFTQSLGATGAGDDYFYNPRTLALDVGSGASSSAPIHYDLTGGNGVTTTTPLSTFLKYAGETLGYLDTNISIDAGITDVIIGGLINTPTGVTQLLQTVSLLYDFAWSELGGKIIFTKNFHGTAANVRATLGTADMSQLSEGQQGNTLQVQMAAPDENPGDTSITYIDPTINYAYNTQIFRRVRFPFQTIDTLRTQNYSVPFILQPSEALTRAGNISYSVFSQSITYTWRLPHRFLALEPADVVQITNKDDGTTELVQITQLHYNADWSLSLAGINWNFNAAGAVRVPVPSAFNPPTVGGPSISVDFAFDIPLLVAADNVVGSVVVYNAVGSLGQSWWSGANVFKQSSTFGQTYLYTTNSSVQYGTTTTALPACGPTGDRHGSTFQTDNTTVLSVTGRSINSSAFSSITNAQLLAGVNAALVGDVGRWELIFFQNVTVVDSATVQLSGILRGRRGTDVNTDSHQIGDSFILLNYPQMRKDYEVPASIGSTFWFWAQGFNAPANASRTQLTLNGNSHRPWAPVNPTMSMNGGNDITMTWKRRDRLFANANVAAAEPMTETAETYQLDIYSGSTIVRTVTGLTSPTYTYTSAQQITDGFSPPLATLKWAAYQMSSLVGRGFSYIWTLPIKYPI